LAFAWYRDPRYPRSICSKYQQSLCSLQTPGWVGGRCFCFSQFSGSNSLTLNRTIATDHSTRCAYSSDSWRHFMPHCTFYPCVIRKAFNAWIRAMNPNSKKSKFSVLSAAVNNIQRPAMRLFCKAKLSDLHEKVRNSRRRFLRAMWLHIRCRTKISGTEISYRENRAGPQLCRMGEQDACGGRNSVAGCAPADPAGQHSKSNLLSTVSSARLCRFSRRAFCLSQELPAGSHIS
jgi:hypothetical protein